MQNKNISSMFRSRSRAIALEPRLLFDGAGAVAVVDAVDSEPVVGENDKAEAADSTQVLEGWEVSGSTDVTVEVGGVTKGALSGTDGLTYTGPASGVDAWLAGIRYEYTGTSEVGDEDTITLTVKQTGQDDRVFEQRVIIAAQNDAPIVDVTEANTNYIRLKVDEGGSVTFTAVNKLTNGVNGAELGARQDNIGLYDPDNIAEQIIIKITELPTDGTLTLNGVTLTEGATFSLDEISLLKYTHNGDQVLERKTESFKISIDDGAGGLLVNQEVFIDILPVNDAPSISGADSIVIIQGEGRVGLTQGGSLPVIGGNRGKLEAIDPDDTQLSYVITELPSVGVLYYDGVALSAGNLTSTNIVDLDKLSYAYPKDLEPTDASVNGQVTFKIQVKDAGGGAGTDKAITITETIKITILDNNNDPYFTGAFPEPVDGKVVIESIDYADADKTDNTITITKDMLPLKDADSFESNLVFTVTGSNHAQSGYFTVDGNLLAKDGTQSATFTYQDVVDNKVQYHLFGTNATERTDFIDFTIKDGAKTIVFPEGEGAEAFARDGGIYQADKIFTENVTDADLQVFRLQVNVPANTNTGVGEGTLPVLPAIATTITVGGDKSFTILEGAGTLGSSAGYTLTNSDLSALDSVSSPEQITYRLETVPSSGTIYLSGKALKQFDSFTQKDINDGKVVFKHSGAEQFADSFQFSVSNGSIVTDSLTTFTIDVTPQNDSPTAADAAVSVAEGKAVVIPVNLSDPDNERTEDKGTYGVKNTVGYRVESIPEHGSLYLVDAGTDLNSVDYKNPPAGTAISAGDIFTATELAGKQLIYVHGGSENYSASFKIVPIDDRGVTGGAITETNQSSQGAEATINITINPRNDAPVFVNKGEPGYGSVPKLDEGGTVIIAGGSYTGSMPGKTGSGTATAPVGDVAHLIFQDSDNSSVQRQYRVTEAPKYGTLTLDGKALSKGSIFTQADLDSGKIQYKHDGSENHADGFNYVVSDGDWTTNELSKDNSDPKAAGTGVYAQGADTVESSRYNILIAPANDAPKINRTPAPEAGGKQHIIVDSATTGTSLGSFTIKDPDLDALKGALPDGVTDHFRVTVTVPEGLELVDTTGMTLKDGSWVIEGTREAVTGVLDSLKVKVISGQDPNKVLEITIMVDDRIYDAEGNVIGANGGIKNEGDENINNGIFNTSKTTIEVWASAKNDLPVVTVPNDPIVVHEDVRTKLDSNAISYTDPDAFDSTNNTVTLTVAHGSLYFAASGNTVTGGATVDAGAVGSNTVTLKGTKAQLDAALENLYYQGKPDFNGTDSLSITVDDGGNYGQDGTENADLNTGAVGIHILPVNDAPTLVLPGKDSYIPITGGSYTFSDTNGNAIKFDDAKDFTYDEDENGHQHAVDNFKVTLEAKNSTGDGHGVFSFADTITDGKINISGSDVTVTVDGAGKVTLEGSHAAVNAVLANGVTYTPDGDANLDGNITLTVTVDDMNNGGSKLIDTQTGNPGIDATGIVSAKLYLQPTAENDPPEFVDLDNTPIYVQNSDKAVVLDSNAKLKDPELDLFGQNGNWQGAVLTLERDGGANAKDVFAVTGSGSTGVNISESNIRIGNTVVGTVTNSGGKLEVTFNDKATAARVDQVLQAITYRNTDTSPEATVKINYTIRDGNTNIDPTNGETTGVDGGGQDQGTGGELTGAGSITVEINRQVVATDDTNTAVEDGTNPAGNVITDGVDTDPDLSVTDRPDQITVEGIKRPTDSSSTAINDSANGGKGTAVVGEFGTLYIKSDGSYTYEVDNNNLNVQGLIPGDTVEEKFVYTVNDGRGVHKTTADATLTISIDGANDEVTVTVPALPVTDPTVDTKDAKDHVVFESGLPTIGSSPNPDAIKVESSFTIEALDGLDPDAALTLTVGGSTTTLTKTQVEALSSSNQTVNTEHGTLLLKGYSQAADGEITIAYTYTLTSKSTDTNNEGVIDTVTITAQDRGGKEGGGKDSNTQDLQFKIIDDAPVATNDTGSIRSGETLVVNAANGVLENDKSGADGWNTEGAVVGVEQGAVTVTVDGSNYVIEGTHGTLTLNKDGSYSYQAKPDTGGKTDTFTYTVEDADGNTATAELKITIAESGLTLTPVADGVEVKEANLPEGTNPNAGGTPVTVTKDLPLTSGTTSLKVVGLNKDTDELADTITTEHGTVTLEKDNDDKYTGNYTFTLTKQADHTGDVNVSDTFTYTAKDDFGNTVTNTVTIKIIDDAPEAKDDVVKLDNKASASGNALTDVGDGQDKLGADGATVTGVDATNKSGQVITGNVGGTGVTGTYGTLVLNADGSYTYTRNAVVVVGDETDVFTYTITDNDGDTSTATITIEIGNKLPKDLVATPDGSVNESGLPSGSTPNDGSNKTTGTITYTPGDGEHTATVKDKNNVEQPVTVGKVIDTPKGKVKITAVEKGKITYEYELTTNTSGDSTTDEFDVTIKDEDGDPATVTVKVGIVNDKPAANADTGNVVQGQSSTGNVITNDKSGADGWKSGGAVVDVEQSGKTTTTSGDNYTIETDLGTLTLNKNGTYTYEAKPGVGGAGVQDVFTYRVEDGDGDQVTTTLTINISDNTPPEANNDFAETDEDTPVSGNLLTNDKDPDGDPITVTEITVGGTTTKVPTDGSNITITVPGKGKIRVNKNGGYTFTPNPGVTGKIPDIGYKITDGNGGDDTAKLSINVKPGNPPVAPPVTNIPDDSRHSPLGGTPEITRMKGLTDSAVITDPSVFYEGERHDDVRRLPIPLQPIVYVNNEVATAQQQRHADDMRADSSPAHIQPFAGQSISLAMGLGQDRNLFVSHAVRDTQQTAATLDSRVAGRLSRVDLSADDMLASNDLRSSQFALIDANEAEKEKQKRQQAAQVEESEVSDEEVTLQLFDADETDVFAEQQAMPVAASFTEQLRGTSKHLPFAAREKNFLI